MQGPLGSPPPQQPQGYEQFLAALSPQQRAQYDSARSQGLTPPTFVLPGNQNYKKGGMVTKAPAAPAPKSDMLYSKKEVNAKNLLPGGKAPSLPRARGSVNMAKGGATCMAKGGKK